MILVDTSVWIKLLSRRPGAQPDPDLVLEFATCGPVVQEVLQGFRNDHVLDTFRESFLALPRLSDPLPLATFLHAADLYRHGRSKGFTIRSGVDCLIAAIAIENRAAVWHQDRDFDTISRFTTLAIWRS